MSNNPWMKFYPSDWQGDEALQMASLAARGLWIECLCIMHNNGGYLQIGNQPVTERHLSIKVGVDTDQLIELFNELESLGVFSRTRKGVIYSRRLLSDLKKSKKARKNGQKGGSPSLCYKTENQNWVNLQDKPPDKPPRGQRPEKKEKNKKENPDKPPDVSEDVWSDFCQHRKAKKAPVTATVLKRLRNEADRANWSLEDAMAEACARGWQSFKAEYVQNTNRQNQPAAKQSEKSLPSPAEWQF